ncbi:MAG TPA: CocE/NonD family hydrolase [Usitatibacteraceae bacterium]|nr:CocE/NonD family hydrolase [Usitatibacteraceae bacterium]
MAAVLAWAGMAAFLWAAQDGMLFFPQPVRGPATAPPGWALEPVALAAADGTPLAGVLALPPGAATVRHPAVMYFGGNAEEVTASAREAGRRYGRRAVLLVNYRGYGDSGGKPGEAALVADALALHDWLSRHPRVDAARIAVHGRSLGSAVAVQLAAARPVRCAVLTSPFESLAAVGRAHYPWLPVGMLLRHRFDSAAAAARVRIPALVIHAGADTIIPPAHSDRLAQAWGGPVERLALEAFGHNDLDLDPRVDPAIAAFLDRHL